MTGEPHGRPCTSQSKGLSQVEILLLLILHQFQNISIATIIRIWNEVAFSSSSSHIILPGWSTPRPRLVELKFNGIAIGNQDVAGVSGILCDNVTASIISFSGLFPPFLPMMQICWAYLRTSHRKAHRPDLRHIMVERGSLCAIRWALGLSEAQWGHSKHGGPSSASWCFISP